MIPEHDEEEQSPRNIQFAGFAHRVINECLIEYPVTVEPSFGWLDEWKLILAQRVYDLVMSEEPIDPDTAIVAFMGWLTSRDKIVGPFSARHDAGQAAELIKKFCQAQGWQASSERFHRQIEQIKKMYPE